MILSKYMYEDIVARREDVGLLISMQEIFGDQIPSGALEYGIKLCDTPAYDYFASFATIPDDAVICIMRPFVIGNNGAQARNQFAIEYFLSIASFGN